MSKTQEWICKVDGNDFGMVEAHSVEEALLRFVEAGIIVWTLIHNPGDVGRNLCSHGGEMVYFRASARNEYGQDDTFLLEVAEVIEFDPDEPQCIDADEHTWKVSKSNENATRSVCRVCGCEKITHTVHHGAHLRNGEKMPYLRFTKWEGAA